MSRKILSLMLYHSNFISLIESRVVCGKYLNCGPLAAISGRNFITISRKSFEIMGCATSKVTVSRSTATSQNEDDEEYVEGVVCQENDVHENEMKAFDLEDVGKVLVVKQKGEISAIGYKCAHYGAPLVNGALGDGRVRCQWHGACFNIKTGDIEDYPGLDSLPCYQVSVANGQVTVRARRSELESNKRVKPMVRKDAREGQKIVVVGGGPSAATCVETLRQEGYKGEIAMICKENCLPYDRVKVSKVMDFEIDKAQLRNDDFYKSNDIDVYKGNEATKVDSKSQTVTLKDGTILSYDRLFIATGLRAEKIKIPGADLKNVVVLRNYEDSKYTNALLTPDKDVVVLGSSFVALEAANFCVDKVKTVTVVQRADVPFKALLGQRIGGAVLKLFQSKGVNFVLNSGLVKCFDDGTGQVKSVELKDGGQLNADIVIMGVGSSCCTEFLSDSGIAVRADGSIDVDDYLQSNISNIYIGGDIAHAPVWSHHNEKSTIGHYPLAHYHGKIAALNMLGKTTRLQAVPYFWTMVFGKGIRYAGHGSYTDIIYHGDVDNFKFVAFYLNGDRVVAASSCGMDPVVSQFAELLAQGETLDRKDLESGDALDWTKRLH